MIVFETIVRLDGEEPLTGLHSTRQAAVINTIKHRSNPKVTGIEVHKTKITIKGKETLECVYSWSPDKSK